MSFEWNSGEEVSYFAEVKYGEREYAYAAPIAAALGTNPEFRRWVLHHTKFASLASSSRVLVEEMKARRSPRSSDWWRSHYSQKCQCDGCRGRETDLLAIVELSVTQDDDGSVWISWTDFRFVAGRYQLRNRDAQITMATEVAASIASAARKQP